MQINLEKAGKRFNRDWIFRNLSFSFLSNESYAITGPNGSGKSTLLQVIAGAADITEGKISYSDDKKELDPAVIFRQLAIAAPYLELTEEFSAREHLSFHEKFRSAKKSIDIILAEAGLSDAADKQIRYFSSGMKQRLKLAMAFCFHNRLILLDEPQTNLDEDGISLYNRWFTEASGKCTVIVGSNEKREYANCRHILNIRDFK